MTVNRTEALTDSSLPLAVSVIVPVYNGERDLPALISCLQAQTYHSERVEYLLVDNASQDNTAAIIQAAAQEAQSQGVTIRYLSENKIQTSYAARNAGIRAATGEILAFTDVDCRPQPNWLDELIKPFISHPDVGLVVGTIEATVGKTLLEAYAAHQKILSTEFTLAHPFCPYGPTANIAIRLQVLKQVGLFRSYLTTGGDADLCWRIQQQSHWQLHFAEQAIVQHRHRSQLQELISQWRRYGRSHKYLHELHGIDLTSDMPTYQYVRRLGGWLIKDLPINGLKALLGKAKPVELVVTPIKLITVYAKAAGQREASLLPEARQIDRL